MKLFERIRATIALAKQILDQVASGDLAKINFNRITLEVLQLRLGAQAQLLFKLIDNTQLTIRQLVTRNELNDENGKDLEPGKVQKEAIALEKEIQPVIQNFNAAFPKAIDLLEKKFPKKTTPSTAVPPAAAATSAAVTANDSKAAENPLSKLYDELSDAFTQFDAKSLADLEGLLNSKQAQTTKKVLPAISDEQRAEIEKYLKKCLGEIIELRAHLGDIRCDFELAIKTIKNIFMAIKDACHPNYKPPEKEKAAAPDSAKDKKMEDQRKKVEEDTAKAKATLAGRNPALAHKQEPRTAPPRAAAANADSTKKISLALKGGSPSNSKLLATATHRSTSSAVLTSGHPRPIPTIKQVRPKAIKPPKLRSLSNIADKDLEKYYIDKEEKISKLSHSAPYRMRMQSTQDLLFAGFVRVPPTPPPTPDDTVDADIPADFEYEDLLRPKIIPPHEDPECSSRAIAGKSALSHDGWGTPPSP